MIIMLFMIGSGYMRGFECVVINILNAGGLQCQGVNGLAPLQIKLIVK